jgi:hypothetical protein
MISLRDAEEASRRRDGVDLLGMRIRSVLHVANLLKASTRI